MTDPNQPALARDPAGLTNQIESLLVSDPLCGGRVTGETVRRIAAICDRASIVADTVERLEVIQADRDAAADYLATIAPSMPRLLERAKESPSALARAFACHRIASSATIVADTVERCARIAENRMPAVQCMSVEPVVSACADIAFAIRALADAPPSPAGDALPPGMVPWHGGDSAPKDWDGGSVLFRSLIGKPYRGDWSRTWDWRHGVRDSGAGDIIAYTPRATPAPESSADVVEASAWNWMESKWYNLEVGHDPNDRDYCADEMVDAFIAGHSSAALSNSTKSEDGE